MAQKLNFVSRYSRKRRDVDTSLDSLEQILVTLESSLNHLDHIKRSGVVL
jgi:hypothetical protein